ncbi:Methyltransferase type 11 [Geobacter metallireducens RCH3]|uniref:SAM-dependent methyltransferase, putative n=1 Tax=Geobacter metallireducens (strain ATCC 53774 / DSM 7210 / GS-15) TaxID=269799 RepID=Q39XI7_GEOMG|nr:class I SAM-dependent methyltransferase [Geobacter metallireducens]ABB31037.1 SAM-dependent methyltransferase, putative [Geobacter metallireducens GS-15]EHP86043.1 Methyltransferase type 11 [Geobacter metallireducens RCH3]
MAQQFKDYFSEKSDVYRSYRPGYPTELFAWLAGLPARRDAALDCGCGTGQASVALAEHFARVYAVDPSAGQIKSATPHKRVEYRVAPAEETGLPDASVDLVIAAQALHWFDFSRFYAEVRRVARGGAVFAAFTYGLLAIDDEIDRIIGRFYRDVIGPYWPPERAHVDAGYRTLPFPFAEIETPTFAMKAEWDLGHLMGYFETWSAVKEYRRLRGDDPLELVAGDLATAWGDPALVRQVSWPLVLRAGRIE